MTEVRVPLHAIKGRGAATAIAHRFARDERDAFDDGWGTVGNLQGGQADSAGMPGDAQSDTEHESALADDPFRVPRAALATQVTFEDAKSVITRNDSPDLYFDYGMNPYRGCEHGCVYCYARPTHSYLGLSPGLDFETKIIAKRNLADVLARELQAPGYVPHGIALGTVTDGYQPVERELKLTRAALQVMARCHQPVGIVTKGAGVERDLDLLAPMAAQRLAVVYVTLTTLDGALARKLEPRAAAPHRRLRSIRALADAGVPVGVSVGPQIPFINDDMEATLTAAWEAGARSAFYTVLRLPQELNPLFQDWLMLHYPDRAARVLARVQDLHGVADAARRSADDPSRAGKVYNSDFATRMKGGGLWADLIQQRFEKTCAKLGFNRQRVELDLTQFRPALLAGQGDLF
jgi:DNA repair photolyase